MSFPSRSVSAIGSISVPPFPSIAIFLCVNVTALQNRVHTCVFVWFAYRGCVVDNSPAKFNFAVSSFHFTIRTEITETHVSVFLLPSLTQVINNIYFNKITISGIGREFTQYKIGSTPLDLAIFVPVSLVEDVEYRDPLYQ